MNRLMLVVVSLLFVLFVVTSGYSARDQRVCPSPLNLADKVVVTDVGTGTRVVESPCVVQYGDRQFILGTCLACSSRERTLSKVALPLDAIKEMYIYDDIDSYWKERGGPAQKRLQP